MASSVKQAFIELVQSLPDDCTWEDVQQQLYLRAKREEEQQEAEQARSEADENVSDNLTAGS